jgi:glucose-6-phosphate 1-epimerase
LGHDSLLKSTLNPQLRSEFMKTSVPGLLLEAGPNGLSRLRVQTGVASGELFLHGAHLTGWQPAGHRPVLWLSGSSWFEAGKPIRGGVPICFPWFGPHPQDSSLPAHGTARLQEWQLQTASAGVDGAISLLLQAAIGSFSVQYELVIGRELHLRLTCELPAVAAESERFEAALHTYLAVSDIRAVEITGLENGGYLNKVPQLQWCEPTGEPIRFSAETDRVYQNTTETVVLHDPGMQRKISVSKQGSMSTVIWNPWIDKSRRMPDFGDDEWTGMVCIETACVGDQAIVLRPGQSHQISATISVAE